MTTPAERSLDSFFARYLAREEQRTGGLPRVAFDADWPSPAQCGEPSADGTVAWRPCRQQPAGSLDGLETALALSVHPDAVAFYTRYFAAHVDASYEQGALSLLFVWNTADFDLAQGNLIGHALEKRRVRQPFTVFIANIDDGRFLSIDNDSGRVMLEVLGARKPLEVAPSLGDFMDRLTAPAGT